MQISDIHPRSCAAMDHTRIPELKAKIEACHPDLLVLTGDIFDEFTEPEELQAFCALFGGCARRWANTMCWATMTCSTTGGSQALAAPSWSAALLPPGVRILEDTSVMLPCGVRIVGRKDYLYTNGSRFTAAS